MKPKVDQDKCIGCGTCAAISPNDFEMIDGKAHAKENANADENLINQAKDACPVSAITFE